MDKKYISQAVINRVPRYYRYSLDLISQGTMRISSKKLAEMMGLTASQIRQDLNCFGGFGQQGYGYNVESLRDELQKILGVDKEKKAVIIGMGNIGRALAKNFHFERSNVNLVSAFDISEGEIDTINGKLMIYSIEKLGQYIIENKIDVAILTIPKDSAKDIATIAVDAGVKGIWNFTSCDLHLEGFDLPIENVHFSDSLRRLSYNMECE